MTLEFFPEQEDKSVRLCGVSSVETVITVVVEAVSDACF